MVIVLIFIFGMVLGSFYNVIALRRPLNESIITPSSHCPACKHSLSWYELVPVISYILLLGKCKHCKKKISLLYPIVEFLTGFIFAVGYLKYDISYEFFALCIISSLSIITFISDFKFMVILDGPLIIASISLIILKYVYFGFRETALSLGSGIVLFLMFFAIKTLGDKIYKRESLGGGDVKLAFFIGISLGLQLSGISLICACLLAFPYAIYITFKSKKREMPFGPFLIAGVFITFIYMDAINEILNILI